MKTAFICHRINSVKNLKELPIEYGVEIDLRDRGDRLIMEHDPFSDGEDFEDYAREYKHGTMILNIKSERVEYRVLEILKKYNIKDYFFLDSSFPMIYLLSSSGEKNIAVRYSEIEPLENAVALSNHCNWVWVDCFSKLPITKETENILRNIGYKLCLVSPELQGRQEDIEKYKAFLNEQGIVFDAICTKKHNIARWR